MPTYGLIVSPTITTCRQCGKLQEPGIIGYRLAEPAWPLCTLCFIDKEPKLGAILLLRPLARKIEAARNSGGAFNMERMYLQTYDRICELAAQQPRGTSALKELDEIANRMEELHDTVAP